MATARRTARAREDSVRTAVIRPLSPALVGVIALALLLAFLVAQLVVPSAAFPVTSATISVDGDLSDWAGVRLDPSNSVGDTIIPSDPDYPGQPDRDVYLTSVTYDSQYLYFAWRRTASGTKAITFGAYLDTDCDGVLKDGDKVVSWVVSTGQPYASAQAASPSAWVFLYNQARTKVGNNVTILNPSGDPMGRDGDTPDGWADIQSGQVIPTRPMDAWFAPNGIECEAKVAWADLGVLAGTPIGIHISSGNGNAWGSRYVPSNTWKWTGSPPQYLEENRGQVEDNAGELSLSARSVLVSPNGNAGGACGHVGHLHAYDHELGQPQRHVRRERGELARVDHRRSSGRAARRYLR